MTIPHILVGRSMSGYRSLFASWDLLVINQVSSGSKLLYFSIVGKLCMTWSKSGRNKL